MQKFSDIPSTQRLDAIIPASLFIAVLSISILQYSTYLIHNDFIDKLIKAVTIVFLLFSIKRYRLLREVRILLFLYCALFGSAFIGAVMTLDISGISQLSKIIFSFLIFPVILFVVPAKGEPHGLLLKMPLYWGLFFSIQSIILFLIIFFNVPIKSTIIVMGKYGDMQEISYGILGYANGLRIFEDYSVLRAQSWFIEPSILASYLIYPVLASFGYYRSTKKTLYLFVSIACIIGILITFSLAAFFSLLVSIVFLLCIRPVYKRNNYKIIGLRDYTSLLIAFIISGVCVNYVMLEINDLYVPSITSSKSILINMIARDPEGPSGQLFREHYKYDEYINILRENPLGIGLGFTAIAGNEKASANALIYWTISGGIPAFIALLALYAKLFYSYCLPLLKSQYYPYRFIGAAFLGTTIHGLAYSNWVYPYYLFNVAVTIICAMYEKRNKENNNEYPKLKKRLSVT